MERTTKAPNRPQPPATPNAAPSAWTAEAHSSRLEHKKDQAQEPANWGYPGDLGHITEELAYILASLGDRSAVDAKGLEY